VAAFLHLSGSYNSPSYRPTSTVQSTISPSAVNDNSATSVPVVGITSGSVGAERLLHTKPKANVFAVGDYLIGDADDGMLNGHPDIRY